MQESQQQTSHKQTKKYFTQIPNIIDNKNLSVRAYRLYGHLKTIFGVNYTRACTQNQERLGAICRMSTGSIVTAKKELVEKGLIKVDIVKTKRGNKHSITGINIEKENEAFFQKAIEDGHTPFSSKIIEPSTRIKPLGRNQSPKRTKAYKDAQKAKIEAERLEQENAAKRRKIINVKISSDKQVYSKGVNGANDAEVPFDIQIEKEKTSETNSEVLKKYYFNLNKNSNTTKTAIQLHEEYHEYELAANDYSEDFPENDEYTIQTDLEKFKQELDDFFPKPVNFGNFEEEFNVSSDDEKKLQKLEDHYFDQFRSYEMPTNKSKLDTEEYYSVNNSILYNNTISSKLDSANASSNLDPQHFLFNLPITKNSISSGKSQTNNNPTKQVKTLDNEKQQLPELGLYDETVEDSYSDALEFYLSNMSNSKDKQESETTQNKINVIYKPVVKTKTEQREVLNSSHNTEQPIVGRPTDTKNIKKVKEPKVKEPKPPKVLSIRMQLEQKKRDDYETAKLETKNKKAEKNLLMKVIDKAHKEAVNYARQSRWITLLVWKYGTDDCIYCLKSLIDNWRAKGEDIRFRPDWLTVWKSISEWKRRKENNIPMRKESSTEQQARRKKENDSFIDSLSTEDILRIRGQIRPNLGNLLDSSQSTINNDFQENSNADFINLNHEGENVYGEQQTAIVPQRITEQPSRISTGNIPNSTTTTEQARGFLSKLRESANSAATARKNKNNS